MMEQLKYFDEKRLKKLTATKERVSGVWIIDLKDRFGNHQRYSETYFKQLIKRREIVQIGN